MSIGNPLESFIIFGRAVPRHMVGYYCLGIYIGLYGLSKIRSSPPPAVTMEPAEAAFVKEYLHKHHEEQHIPPYARGIFKVHSASH
ncbi:hypothetical protein SmJEL517_g02190 [Synchytrium microbalum]|uniref:Uncharacterized protein n=1 Tax=Synchytrium microbalum TaxID=1806994 RepID=A0A507C891_9FUNG|nr:uncharacterized protein SmJEL517_g02190 [Synchytrium microbalum]TPX35538.1 hypothetical protein SmJEL517_g02190 [Synchytrium microbalum]